MTEEELYNLSDEELEAAYKEARSSVIEEDTEPATESTNTEEEEEVEYEDIEEEEVEDLEQPDEIEDSGDDTSSDDDDETESNDDSDSEDIDPDEDNTEDEEQTEDDDEESEEDEQPVQTSIKFKANGKEYDFSEEEIRSQFPKVFGQAMDYTKKMQAIKPWRKTIDAIEGAKLNHDDVNLMIDVLKGDKDAVAEVLKRTGIDALDINTDESKYVAKDYGRDESVLDIKDVVDKISQDPEYTKTENILSKEWDDRSWGELSKNPNLIELLHVDVRSGMYDLVQPIAEKLKVYGRGEKSDLDYYTEAAKIYFSQQEEATTKQQEAERVSAEKARVAEVKAKQQTRAKSKVESAKRKSAAPTKKAVKATRSIDYLDDSDEAFEEWYKNLQENN